MGFTEATFDPTEVRSVGVSIMPSNSDAMGSILVTGPETIEFVGVNDIDEVVLVSFTDELSELDAGMFLYSIFVMTSVIIFVL